MQYAGLPNYKQASGFSASIFTLLAWIAAIGSGIEIYYIFAEQRDFLAGTIGLIVRDNDAIGMLKFYIPVFGIALGIATQRFLVPIVAILSIFAVFTLNGELFHLKSAQGFSTNNLPTVSNHVVGIATDTISDSDMTLDDIKNAPAANIYARANGYTKGRGLTPAELDWCKTTNRTDEHTIINCKSKFKWSKS